MIHLGPLEPAERDKAERQIRMDMDEDLARHINAVIREVGTLVLQCAGLCVLLAIVAWALFWK